MNHSSSPLRWDDLRIVLAIARGGSVRAAAKRLLLSHATVSRHLAELHEQMGVRLFDRDGRRLRPTIAGVDLIETAERIEAEVDGVALRVAGRDVRLRGVVRVALPTSMLVVLAPAFTRMHERYPEIQLEIDTRLELSNLTRREADLAVRLTDSPQPTLVGRKAGRFEVAVYRRRDGRRAVERGWAECPWITWDERHRGYRPAGWVLDNIPSQAIRASADSETAMLELVRAGVGIGYLPRVLGDHDPSLTLVEPPPPCFSTNVWVLTHPDLRETGRVRAVMTYVADALAERLPPSDAGQ